MIHINNEFYKDLGDRWFTAQGDAVALLRLEKAVTTPWVIDRISAHHNIVGARVLDVGCGGGLLSLDLAERGAVVTGLDVSENVLQAGRARDPEHKINWAVGKAENLPFNNQTYDVVCLMDVLEHVFDPFRVISESVRVLRPGGTLLFHTFNRTFLAWLLVDVGLDWFIRDSQKDIHDAQLFIKPRVIRAWLNNLGFTKVSFNGIRPRVFTGAFAKLVFTRRVPENFKFELCKSLSVGYLGCARA